MMPFMPKLSVISVSSPDRSLFLTSLSMIIPDNIEQKLDFTLLRDRLNEYCISSFGREEVEAMTFLTDYNTILHLLRETEEMLHILTDASIDFPRGDISDLRSSLARIRVEGLFLDEAELFSLRHTLDYAAQLERFFAHLDAQRFPILSVCASHTGLKDLSSIVTLIDSILDKYGQLRDSASPELARIRHELTLAQGSVTRAISSILRQAQAEGFLDKDVTPTMREGRLVLPVPPAYRRKLGGIVHDESATGKTVYVEPQQVVEANNHIRSLQSEERRERARILSDITARLRPSVPDILQVSAFLGHIDFVRAKATLAHSLHAIAPEFLPHPLLDLHSARHPLLYLRFLQENRQVVPLHLSLVEQDRRILVISGPNAGGKSVCLKTVALLQYMLQCGLLIPVDESSRVGLFSHILMDIGDEQSIADDLSTYSSHLRNMKAFIRIADPNTLFLIDEFGSGTEPLIGGAIAEAILLALNERQAFGVVTTHYTNLKHLAGQTTGLVNGAMLYDRGALRPLFQLSIGQPGSSFAIEIAHSIGLPDAIIAQAKDLIGEEHIDYDRQLQDIARDRRYWENKRQNIRQREKHLEEKISFYEAEISTLKQKKREIIQEANQQAADILRQSNATIERTIREIKESKADKERTQQARRKVETLKTKVSSNTSLPFKEGSGVGSPSPTSPASPSTRNGKSVLHDFSDLRALAKSTARLHQEANTPRRQVVTTSVVSELRRRTLSFSRELDLRGLRADEALEQLIAYMDDAVMVSAGEVTILHGTGTGALKQITRDYLSTMKRHHRIHDYHDGDPDRGGAGLTLVEL